MPIQDPFSGCPSCATAAPPASDTNDRVTAKINARIVYLPRSTGTLSRRSFGADGIEAAAGAIKTRTGMERNFTRRASLRGTRGSGENVKKVQKFRKIDVERASRSREPANPDPQPSARLAQRAHRLEPLSGARQRDEDVEPAEPRRFPLRAHHEPGRQLPVTGRL